MRVSISVKMFERECGYSENDALPFDDEDKADKGGDRGRSMGLFHDEKRLVGLVRRENGEVACGGSKSKKESWSSHSIALPQRDCELA